MLSLRQAGHFQVFKTIYKFAVYSIQFAVTCDP
jgi:hypothetical protein